MTRIRLRGNARGVHKVACALVAASVVSACTTSTPTVTIPTEPLTSSTSTPATTSSMTPSPATSSATTTTPPSQNEQVQAAVVAFWAVLDRVSSDPKTSLNLISTVAHGTASATWKNAVFQKRTRGERQVGVTRVEGVTVRVLTPSRFEVAHCLDVSATDLLDSKGKSIVRPGRPVRVEYQLQLERATDGHFYVTEFDAVGSSC